VAVHLLGLGGRSHERGGEFPRLLDGERVIRVQIVNHDVAGDAAVVVLGAVDVGLDVGVMVRAVDDRCGPAARRPPPNPL
jgi:hypothetical protein